MKKYEYTIYLYLNLLFWLLMLNISEEGTDWEGGTVKVYERRGSHRWMRVSDAFGMLR